MRRRRLALVCALVMLLTLSPATPPPSRGLRGHRPRSRPSSPPESWPRRRRRDPNDPLTRGELETIVAGLTHTEAAHASLTHCRRSRWPRSTPGSSPRSGSPTRAKLFTQAAKPPASRLPPASATEAVARLLGLRTNHPAALDDLELLARPTQPPAPRPPSPPRACSSSADGTLRPSGAAGIASSCPR